MVRRIHVLAVAGLGATLWHGGRFEEAVDAYREMIAIHTRAGQRMSIADGLLGMASTMESAGRYDDAISTYRRALVFAREVGSTHSECEVRAALGEALVQAARP